MGVFKEIPKNDGSGITTFYRISQTKATVETDSDEATETMIDYNSALNKPSINDVMLSGNKTSADLGLQPAGDYALKSEIPTQISQLENDLDFATKQYVIEQVSSAEHFHREIVDVLPDVGKDNILYLLKKKGKQGDFYDEYLWMNPGYEFIGTTATNLSDYYKKSEVDAALEKKVNTIPGKILSTNDYTDNEKNKLASLENYNDSALWNTVNALHNYDDTVVKADIATLKTQMEGANSELEILDEKIEYQITLIRLIKHGDTWIWENSKDDILTFQDAFNQLGNSDVLFCLENVESDGKVYPSYYNAEDDHVRIYYLDKEHGIHLLNVSATEFTDTILGEDVVYQPKVDSVEKLPTIANKGEIRLVGNDDAVYLYDGSKWVPIDKGTSIDLSNYLPKDNTVAFNPTGNYNPATKKYVDDKIGNLFIPTKVSQLTNDSQFIGKNTNDLANYYPKTKTYTKAEVDALIAAGGSGGGSTQAVNADWSDNDETSKAYVKNRTHYVEKDANITQKYNINTAKWVNIESSNGSQLNGYRMDISFDKDITILDGQKITITIRSQEYTTTLHHTASEDPSISYLLRGDFDNDEYVEVCKYWDSFEGMYVTRVLIALVEALPY